MLVVLDLESGNMPAAQRRVLAVPSAGITMGARVFIVLHQSPDSQVLAQVPRDRCF